MTIHGFNQESVETAQMSFETGHIFRSRDFESKKNYADYLSLMEYGPLGFYEEFKDELLFDDMFVEEYEY